MSIGMVHTPQGQETALTNQESRNHNQDRDSASWRSSLSSIEKHEEESHENGHAHNQDYSNMGGGRASDQSLIANKSRTNQNASGEDTDLEKQNNANNHDQQHLPAGKQSQHQDPNLVIWDGPDDPENPMNFPTWKKWVITIGLGTLTFVVTFASSVFSTATMVTAKHFDVSPEVMVLGVSLFVAGFAVGPIIWGPLSEVYGRKTPLFTGYFIFAVFQIPVAVARNVETIFLCRFFGGVFGSAPLAIVGGALADIWDPVQRGVAICVFASATFIGPACSPIIGSFITQSDLGWRWTAWLTAIMGFSFWIIWFPLIPETSATVLLQRRAKYIRYKEQNWAIHAKADEVRVDLEQLVFKYLIRPFTMLALEPILLLITIYIALIYGILYLFFESYPIAFGEVRGWSPGLASLPFIGILVGVVCGNLLIIYTTKTRFKHKMEQQGRVVPEERLIPMMIGGALFPAGLFWFAWTSHPGTPWGAQVVAGIPIGLGVICIFMQGLTYIIDCYTINANSAIAANAFVRGLFGAGFPMFATGMYHNLGVDWATTTLAFIALALFPVPILFYIYGPKIRQKSKYVPTQ